MAPRSHSKDKTKPNPVVYYDKDENTIFIKADQRLLSRIDTGKELYLQTSSGESFPVYMTDLSGGGAFVKTQAELAIDCLVEISADAGTPPFVRAQVVRKDQKQSGYGIAWLKFFEENLAKGILTKKKL